MKENEFNARLFTWHEWCAKKWKFSEFAECTSVIENLFRTYKKMQFTSTKGNSRK